LPRMPGAGDEVAAQPARGERSALVVADVGDGEDLVLGLVPEEGDAGALEVDGERALLAKLGERAGEGEGVGHPPSWARSVHPRKLSGKPARAPDRRTGPRAKGLGATFGAGIPLAQKPRGRVEYPRTSRRFPGE